MKILFLNPHVDAEHEVLGALKARGLAVLQPGTPEEAWQLLQLHGTSVELAILHREFPREPEAGLKLLAKIKSDPSQSDLPVILTSEQWGDGEFAAHQSTSTGANAYSRWPVTGEELLSLIDAVFGEPVGGDLDEAAVAPPVPMAPAPPPVQAPKVPGKPPAAPPAMSGGLVLEDASSLFARSDKYEASDTSIRLEAPEPEASVSIPTALTSEVSSVSPLEVPAESGALELSVAPESSISIPLSTIEAPSIPTATSSVDSGVELSLEPAGEPGALEIPAASGSAFDASALSLTLPEPGPAEAEAVEEVEAVEEMGTQEALRSLQAPPEGVPTELSGEVDREVAQEMPYLFGKGAKGASGQPALDPALAYAQPMGDAVVPGGAAQSPDVETLKKYLLLREQDVAVLSTQLKTAREQVQALEEIVREERAKNVEVTHTLNEQRRKIEEFEKDKALAVEGLQGELGELRFQLKAKVDKARVMETQVREATEEMERLKERVRSDIRKIRVREKELENRLEITKKDSEALIAARESKIIELKRKLDLLEFNMDLLQDQYAREKENSARLRERLAKAAQVVRVAGGLLDQNGKPIIDEAS